MNTQLLIPLTGPIDPETKDQLLLKLWGSANPNAEDLLCMNFYFNWYEKDIMSIHQKPNKLPEVLLIMTSIGEPPLGTDGPNTIHWNAGTLRDFTTAYFGPAGSGVKLQPDKLQIGRIFTALNLNKIGGMRIEWTRNLADHLRLVDDDKTVSVFDCVAYLRFQRKVQKQLFPPGFIDETLRTLALGTDSTERPCHARMARNSNRGLRPRPPDRRVRQPDHARAALRELQLLEQPAGGAEAGARRGAAADAAAVVVRPAQRRAVVYVLGRHPRVPVHRLLRARAERRGRFAGLSIVAGHSGEGDHETHRRTRG
ncbi:hypothetical protein NPX13_g1562 [Xylaria arbuscula]|uniref:Uncharacterized protein n=1 Tax=Xylaria arbuscula TaxID=114810 RepID=A0A9W8NKU4_9PEZI|nr:hypothetical protein NPX13_g1562 [Xylaria arbuscula]